MCKCYMCYYSCLNMFVTWCFLLCVLSGALLGAHVVAKLVIKLDAGKPSDIH
jgi:hypothetical protein